MDLILQVALHHQFDTLQELSKRMSENSRNAKTWCLSLVSALLVFSSKTLALPWFILVLPILPLMYIDMYYLALETFYRQEYSALKAKYKDGGLEMKNVYDMESPAGNLHIFYQFWSKSVWPFYGLLFLVAAAIGWYLEH
ncbi:hypothetical protein [uncultured Arcticibacterium sp.]|uniref:hypothetical protein n=1 Tax=uncultured Arcticibacterium sp. TaxID=2173042 RepID=UPI0030F64CEC